MVSVARILLVPGLVLLLTAGGRPASYVAAGIFGLGALTDGVDGYLARRYASVTRTGQWLDPLADKVLVSAPVLTMTALDRFPLWAALAIVIRELGVVVLRVVAGLRGRPMPATPAAKLKTALQLTAIVLYILPLGTGAGDTRLGFLVAAVVMTLATGVDYAVRTIRFQRAGVPGSLS